MPVTPTYPGLYLEELPSEAHTITAAPTSVTVFVGYSHPFKTRKFDEAVQVFSFTEYEREFGGLFASDNYPSTLSYGVNQFFLNGGSVAYIVGLRVTNHTAPSGSDTVNLPTLLFTGREPTDKVPMHVSIKNSKPANPGANLPVPDLGDVTITYGRAMEIYRGVSLSKNLSMPSGPPNPRFIDTVVGTAAQPGSQLVMVGASDPVAGYTTSIKDAEIDVVPQGALPIPFQASDFLPVFQADSSLDKVPVFNILCVPGISDHGVVSDALVFAEKKLAFMIVDPPPDAVADGADPNAIDKPAKLDPVPRNVNGALYFPYVSATDPLTGSPMLLPPSPFVAGKYADTDLKRGVWKAPAGLETQITTVSGVSATGRMTNERQGVLNPLGVNCLRDFPNVGTVIFGARTLETKNLAMQQWWYVPVRRMALFIEQTMMANLGWAVFEPNDRPLWTALRGTVNDFMIGLFHQHAFQGDTPSQAFKVVCDETTTTQADIDNGIVNILIAFRPLKPAEFVIIKIAQLAGQPQS
jgi:phage tail sheath protein FI